MKLKKLYQRRNWAKWIADESGFLNPNDQDILNFINTRYMISVYLTEDFPSWYDITYLWNEYISKTGPQIEKFFNSTIQEINDLKLTNQ